MRTQVKKERKKLVLGGDGFPKCNTIFSKATFYNRPDLVGYNGMEIDQNSYGHSPSHVPNKFINTGR